MILQLRYSWDRTPDLVERSVWEARDRLLGARIMMKLIPRDRPAELDRLRHEAAILDRLDHPGVPRLLDSGLADPPWNGGQPLAYLALRQVLGEPPAVIAPRLSPAGRRRMTASALTVLADLHRLDILHGDLSPGNVVVGPDGWTSIIDFGLAQSRAEAAAAPDLRGTPGYLAPERSRGEGGDHRSDLYSLGVLLAEALEAAGEAIPLPVRAMADPIPAARPASAEQVLEKLRLQRAYPSTGGLARPVLIGREPQLDQILEGDSEGTGPGRALLVRSPPGGGLTRFLEALDRRLGWEGQDRLRVCLDGRTDLQGLREILAQPEEPPRAGEPPELLLRRLMAHRRQEGATHPLWLLLDLGSNPEMIHLDPLVELTREFPLQLVIGGLRSRDLPLAAVDLKDLEASETRDLIGSMQGGALPPPGLADLIHSASSGRPGRVVRIVRDLITQGMLRLSDRGFVLTGKDPEALSRLIRQAGSCRPPTATHPLSPPLAVAVDLCEGSLPVRELEVVTGAPTNEVQEALSELRALGLLEVRSGTSGDEVELLDPTHAQALRQGMEEPDLQDLAARCLPLLQVRSSSALGLLELAVLARDLPRAQETRGPAVMQAMEDGAPGRGELVLTQLLQIQPSGDREEAETHLWLLRLHLRYHQPRRCIDAAERILEISQERTHRQEALLALADARLMSGEPDQAADALHRLDEEEPLPAENQVRRCVLQASVEQARGRPDRGLELLQSCEPFLEECRPGHRYQGLEALGRLHLALGRGEEGRPYLEQALEVARETGAHRDAADTAVNLGILAKDAGRLEEARGLYQEAADTYRVRGYPGRLARCLSNLGRLALKEEEPRQAADLLEEALSTAPETMEPIFQARIHMSLGEAYEACGTPDRAEESYRRVRDLTARAGLGLHQALVLQRLGSLQQREGRIGESRGNRVQALRLLSNQPPSTLVERTAQELADEILEAPGEDQTGQGRFEALIQIRRIVEQGSDPERLLDEILRLAVRWTKAERCLILGAEPDSANRLQLHRLHGVQSDDVSDLELFSQSVAREVLRTGRPVVTNDALADPELRRYKSVQHQQLRSILCVPLRSGGQVIGVVYVDHRRRDSLFLQGRAVELLQEFAYLAGAVMDQARERESLTTQLAMAPAFAHLAGLASPAMRRILGDAMKVSRTDCTVLLLGETGTGKGRLAQAIHEASSRQGGPFLAVNLAAMPDNLLESELFGVMKGAHSTAEEDRPGLFTAAHTGSLFLDEIAEPPPGIQAKLLRVLETGRIRPVGSTAETEVDVRLLAATNRVPQEAVGTGQLRQDLFHRLNVFPIRLPPLRERAEDIPELARHFLGVFRNRHQRASLAGFTPAAMAHLQTRPFPGNVRELENLIERATILADEDSWIDVAHLEPSDREGDPVLNAGLNEILNRGRLQLQKQLVESYLKAAQGNIAQAAQMADIKRPNFHRLMRRHGVRREEFLPSN